MRVDELIERHPLVRARARVRSENPAALSRFSLADVHMHTNYSDGTGSVEDVLEHVAEATPLDVIAITDHDTIEGALRAREMAERRNYGFEVIVGEEVSTREGHLLALFLERRVPPGLSIERSIELVHAQRGLAIVAHPFNRVFRHSVQRSVMDRILRQPEIHLDGIETLNGSFAGIGSSRIAMRLARGRYGWPEIGGSDAHTPTAIGCAHTLFAGQGAEGLREALRHGETAPQGSYWQPHEYLVIASHHVAFGRASMYTGVYTKHKEQRAVRAGRLREAAFGWSARAAREYATRHMTGE
ncbi:MAG TPA: PHP-associated domain-containing protein, partial [Ktedonobacterales bacterium]